MELYCIWINYLQSEEPTFNTEDIAFGNGRYISVGSKHLTEYVSGSGTLDNGSINSFFYNNRSISEW